MPCVCSRVQSPLPSVRPSLVCGLCGLSARQSLRGCSVRTTARGCWCVYVQCLHQYFAVTRHSWSSLSNVVVFLFCFFCFFLCSVFSVDVVSMCCALSVLLQTSPFPIVLGPVPWACRAQLALYCLVTPRSAPLCASSSSRSLSLWSGGWRW